MVDYKSVRVDSLCVLGPNNKVYLELFCDCVMRFHWLQVIQAQLLML